MVFLKYHLITMLMGHMNQQLVSFYPNHKIADFSLRESGDADFCSIAGSRDRWECGLLDGF